VTSIRGQFHIVLAFFYGVRIALVTTWVICGDSHLLDFGRSFNSFFLYLSFLVVGLYWIQISKASGISTRYKKWRRIRWVIVVLSVIVTGAYQAVVHFANLSPGLLQYFW